jgi:5'-nucleotidase / UDP-sugar diphosphatase
MRAVSAAVTLGVAAACGGGAAAPTPTAVTSATVAAPAPAASPQRPALASPVASPSAAVVTSTGASASPAADVAGGTTYEVQSGDTLASIAQQQYGDGTLWRRIYDANKDAIGADPDKLKLGMQLKIPPKS